MTTRRAPSPRRTPDPLRGQRGSAVMLVAVLGLLTMALWVTAYRATHDGIRGEAFALQRERRGFVLSEGAARGAALLRTGEPPRSEWACVTVVDFDGELHPCTVLFTRTGPDVYSVEAHPSFEREVKSLPPMPTSFAPTPSASPNSAPGGRVPARSDRPEDRSHADR